jgi:hypothetical protein
MCLLLKFKSSAKITAPKVRQVQSQCLMKGRWKEGIVTRHIKARQCSDQATDLGILPRARDFTLF